MGLKVPNGKVSAGGYDTRMRGSYKSRALSQLAQRVVAGGDLEYPELEDSLVEDLMRKIIACGDAHTTALIRLCGNIHSISLWCASNNCYLPVRSYFLLVATFS